MRPAERETRGGGCVGKCKWARPGGREATCERSPLPVKGLERTPPAPALQMHFPSVGGGGNGRTHS